MNVSIIARGALAAALMAGAACIAVPAAHASERIDRDQAGIVIAQDESAQLTAKPTAPRTITAITEPGAAVTITANGPTKAKPRTMIADESGRVTFPKLTAGAIYTIQAVGKQATAVPVVNVGKASNLTVTTTDRVDTVNLNWTHAATKARGQVGYTVTATPVTISYSQSENSNDDAPAPINIEVTSTSAEISGLSPVALYSFTVTPHNELGSGGASVARMSRSLAEITGIPAPSGDPANVTKPEDHASPAPQPVAQPAPQPGPAPAQQPSTRTIWVCPDGFSDEAGTCIQILEYTFTESTETAPYTYSQNFHQTGWQDGSFRPAPCTFGTYHASGPQGEGCYVAAGPTGYYTTDKDAPPTGWTDDGSQYTRTVSTKDAAPEGYSDNGSAWVRTADKIAKVVPA